MTKLTNLMSIATEGESLLFLRKIEAKLFQWFFYQNGQELLSAVSSDRIEEAFRLAQNYWKKENFSLIRCGYVFTLPERDEHGDVALFSQMVKSLESSSGVYFDEDLGHNCIVHQIPLETRKLYEKLKA